MFSEQSKVKITLYQDNRREPLENLFKNPQQFRPHQIIKQQLSDVESLRRAHLPSDKQGALAIQKHLSPIINLSQWFKPQTNTNQQDKLITLTLDCEITINQKKSVWKDQYKSELEQAINTYMYSNLATYYDSGFAKDPYHILINHIHAYQEAFYSYIRSREHFNEVAFALMETLKAIKPTEIQIWVPTPVNQSRRYYFYFSPIQKLWQNWLFKALIFIFMDVLHRTTIDKFLDKYAHPKWMNDHFVINFVKHFSQLMSPTQPDLLDFIDFLKNDLYVQANPAQKSHSEAQQFILQYVEDIKLLRETFNASLSQAEEVLDHIGHTRIGFQRKPYQLFFNAMEHIKSAQDIIDFFNNPQASVSQEPKRRAR